MPNATEKLMTSAGKSIYHADLCQFLLTTAAAMAIVVGATLPASAEGEPHSNQGENSNMLRRLIQKPQQSEARNDARWDRYESGDIGYTAPLDYSSARR